MSSMTDDIRARLVEALKPERLEVINESHLHAGHQPGFDGEGESHLRIRIVASAFSAMTRLQRHRTISDLVQPEIERGLHALAIEPAAPGEPVRW